MEDFNRERILQAADALFNTRGYKSVTIDDLAEKLGISKKTIYVHFDSKKDIATAVVEDILQHITKKLDEAPLMDENPIDVLRTTIDQIKNEVLRIRPIFMADIQKLLPKLWLRVVTYRDEHIIKFMCELILKAQQLGLAKPLNPMLASQIFLDSLQTMAVPDVMMKSGFSVSEVIDTLTEIFIGGISTHG